MSLRLPYRASREALEATLAGRGALLARLENALNQTAIQGGARFELLVGPRGSGKSHLLALLAHRLSSAVVVLLPALRCESLSVLLMKLLERMPPAEGFPLATRQAEQLLGGGDTEARALRFLDGRLGERPLVILIDDLDRVFAALGATEQARFRAILQERGSWSIVGTARAVSEDFTDRQRPFFRMFAEHPLPALTPREGTSMLLAQAPPHQRASLSRALREPSAQRRLWQTLSLLGGHPEAIVELALHLTPAALHTPTLALEPLAERARVTLQKDLDTLSPGQQAALSPLLDTSEPPMVSEIAQRALQRPQVTSTHLRRLAASGWVRSSASGRTRRYELADPLARFAVSFLAESGNAQDHNVPPSKNNPTKSTPPGASLQGRWRITEMELWDQAATDTLGPAFIELRADGSGSFRFIVVTGDFRYPLGPSHFLADWGGSDECDMAWGELDLELDGERLVGSVSIHDGDESALIARRWNPEIDGTE